MPLLNREPVSAQASGLLIVLAVVLLAAVLRYLPFFMHEVWGLR
jgi:hypothetical protein